MLTARPVSADIAGTARVLDGDTIEIAGTRLRLHGIDAPEVKQPCTAYGQIWPCGKVAKQWLAARLEGREVTCRPKGHDRYDRTVAVCYVGGEDLAGRIVAEGWALDYRKYSLKYVGAENDARAAGRGIWRGTFQTPWDWRAEHQPTPRKPHP
jgi:endonuclease YncB( thermonuclease family)